jgi:hypothetical protein
MRIAGPRSVRTAAVRQSSPLGRTPSLAERLWTRFDRPGGDWFESGAVLAVRRSTTFAPVLRLRLAIQIAQPATAARTAAIEMRLGPGRIERLVQTPPAAAQPGPGSVVERLLAREQRTTHHDHTMTERLPRRRERREGMSGMPGPLSSPAPRVVVRTAGSAAVARAEPDRWQEPEPLRYWDPQKAPGDRLVPDVERLTDQVIQAIDRRVVAARERFGGR